MPEAERRLGHARLALGLSGLACGRGQLLNLGLHLLQPGLLREPYGRGPGSLGAGDEAVPAPEVALAGDQPHAGLQVLLQPGSVVPGDQAREGQARGELGRGAHHGGQGFDAFRPLRLGRLGPAPIGRSLLVEGGVEVVAERRRQGGLAAAFGRDGVHRAAEAVLALGRQQLGEAPRLGLQSSELVLGLAGGVAGGDLGL